MKLNIEETKKLNCKWNRISLEAKKELATEALVLAKSGSYNIDAIDQVILYEEIQLEFNIKKLDLLNFKSHSAKIRSIKKVKQLHNNRVLQLKNYKDLSEKIVKNYSPAGMEGEDEKYFLCDSYEVLTDNDVVVFNKNEIETAKLCLKGISDNIDVNDLKTHLSQILMVITGKYKKYV